VSGAPGFNNGYPDNDNGLAMPIHLRRLVIDTVRNFDEAWLLPPQNGELFDSGKSLFSSRL
jgi:hypothetical protein